MLETKLSLKLLKKLKKNLSQLM